MIKFYDTHAHISKNYYDIPQLMKELEKKNIDLVINDGCNDTSNHEALKLSCDYQNIYCTLGINHEEIKDFKESDLDFIKANLNNPNVVAIGEIGLDYHSEGYDREKQ